MSTQAIIPNGTDYVELSSTSVGSLFRKQILRLGESFVHPKNPNMRITVDDALADALVHNFDEGICDTVQFPVVNDMNQHVEDPERNLGQVIGLTKEKDGVYATIDVRKHAEDVGSTILGASAMFSLDYTDTATGKKVGPTLLHVAATNRPYLTKLAPYEAVALSNAEDDSDYVVFELEENDDTDQPDAASGDSEDELEIEMTKEELIAALRDDHDIDVEALMENADANPAQELVTALSGVLRAADSDLVALSNVDEGEETIEAIAQGVIELSRANIEMGEELGKIRTESATAEVDALVEAGRILPAKRDKFLELRLSNEELFHDLVPDNAIVSLSEDGVQTYEQPGKDDFEKSKATVDHFLALAGKTKSES